jgi:anaerobic selenocysteine-containing dehydrogenase
MSRRSFLKGTGTVGIVAAVGGTALLEFFTLEAEAQSSELVSRWIASTCQGCTAWCPVVVRVVDGRAVHLAGNHASRATHGQMCPRPNIALQQLYDPDRIKVPMRRTNPRKGRDEDPGFVPVSWDEAMGLIADKMMELRENEETHKFAVFRGRYSYLRDIIYSAVPKVFGSPNGISHSAICAEAEKFGAYFTEGFWDYRDYDLEHTRYVLCWGADPLSSNRQVPHAINIWGHVRDRAQIAVVDPRLSATAAKANEWLPVLPGEDAALAVAMAHAILAEGLWSREWGRPLVEPGAQGPDTRVGRSPVLDPGGADTPGRDRVRGSGARCHQLGIARDGDAGPRRIRRAGGSRPERPRGLGRSQGRDRAEDQGTAGQHS